MPRYHARTDVGLKRRQNEDALLALEEEGLFVVADGVGGRKAGELASAITVDTFQAYASRLRDAVDVFSQEGDHTRRLAVLRLLEEVANTASNRVYETAESTGRQGMTTTLAAAIVGGGVAFVVHVGDSRIYLLRDGQLRQLTEDHSLVNEMVRTGGMTREEAARSRYRNVITRAVGLYPNVQADTLAVELIEGDRILICSDGLSDLVQPDLLVTLLRKAEVHDAVESLVDAALDAGGKDNITVIGIDPEATLEADAVVARTRVMDNLFLFQDLPPQARIRVGRILSDRHVKPGEVVVRQGDVGDTLYVVVRGAFSVLIDGAEVAGLGEGEHFGELALVDDSPRSATITARTYGHLLAIQRDALAAWCAVEPASGNRILWKLVATLSDRLRSTNRQLSDSRRGGA
jgi:serine/threonine protein phosphatase PrpC